MKSDYIDALRHGVDYNIYYLGKWNIKEENNMDMPGKLREDVKRIFGSVDPMNCIEDAFVTETPVGKQIQLILRVPVRCEPFAVASPLYTPPRALLRQCLEQVMADIGGVCDREEPRKEEPKPAEKPLDPMDAVAALTPVRVIYSGPKTIAIWPDGTKTMVSLMDGQEHDEYGAFCAAVVKKMFGATHKAKRFLNTVKVVQASKVKKKAKEETPVEEVFFDD